MLRACEVCYMDYVSGFDFYETFLPAEPYRRGAFIHGLVEYAGLSPVKYRGTFPDVSEDDPYAGDWQTAWDEHWISSTGPVRSEDILTVRELVGLLSGVSDIDEENPVWDEEIDRAGLRRGDKLTAGKAKELLGFLLEAIDAHLFAKPTAKFRIHPMEHDASRNPESIKGLAVDTHGGGAVINSAWDGKWNEDPKNLDNLYETARILRKCGLHAWLYDEVYYPSGWAGGYILKDGDAHLAKNIGVLRLTGSGRESVSQSLPEGGIRFIYAAFYRPGQYENAYPAEFSDNVIDAESPEGDWELLAFFIRPCNIWPFAFAKTVDPPIGPRKHLNFLNKDAVAAFIEGALEKVKEHEPGFGDLFEAIFTDEPALQSIYIFGKANKPSFSSVPYGDELFERFNRLSGEELTPLLPYLFFGNDERARTARIEYYRTIASLMSDNFTGQVAAWCHDSHVNYSGHFHSEEHIYFHVGNYGNFLKVASNQDRPGFDMLVALHEDFWKAGSGVYNAAPFLCGKYVSSVSRMKGGNTTMVEVCPVINDGEMKKHIETSFYGLSTDTAFIGATHFNNYGYHFLHDNLVFEKWNDYTGRLCAMLRGARSAAEIAVYYPVEDAQAGMYEPSYSMDTLSDEELILHNYIENLEYNLFLNRHDFNFVTDDALTAGTVGNGTILCGKTYYRVVLMPRVTVIPLAAMHKLEEFKKHGGRVIWLDTLPDMGISSSEHEEVRRIAGKMSEDLSEFRPDDLAMRAKVTASHTCDGAMYSADFVTNGSTENQFSWEGWCSDKLPASLELDLGEEQTVNRFDLYSKTGYEQSSFDVFRYDGGSDEWKLLTSVAGNTEPHVFKEFEDVRLRRVRVVFNEGSKAQPDVARATEIQLYNRRFAPGPEDVMSRLHAILGTTLEVTGAPGSIFVSRYRRGKRFFYYIINPAPDDRTVHLKEHGASSLRLYQPLDGSITEVPPEFDLTLAAGRGIFLEVVKGN